MPTLTQEITNVKQRRSMVHDDNWFYVQLYGAVQGQAGTDITAGRIQQLNRLRASKNN